MAQINNYYNEIKNQLVNNEVYKKVKDYSKNKSDLNTYYNVGRLIVEAQGGEKRAKYGDNLIKEYSRKLTIELGKGYTFTSLSRMRQFYLLFENIATESQLSWSHYVELLKINNISIINYYIKIVEEQNLSVRELRNKIKNKEYERLDNKTKEKLANEEQTNIQDFIKNPIFIKNTYNYTEISEKILKQLILEDLDNFFEELDKCGLEINDPHCIAREFDNFGFLDDYHEATLVGVNSHEELPEWFKKDPIVLVDRDLVIPEKKLQYR